MRVTAKARALVVPATPAVFDSLRPFAAAATARMAKGAAAMRKAMSNCCPSPRTPAMTAAIADPAIIMPHANPTRSTPDRSAVLIRSAYDASKRRSQMASETDTVANRPVATATLRSCTLSATDADRPSSAASTTYQRLR